MHWFAGWLSRWTAGRRLPARYTLGTQAGVEAAEARHEQALADPDMPPLARLLCWWGQPPASDLPAAAIDALELRYAIRLPDDFRAYLMATMPNGNEGDDEGTRWFPLADIKSLREECPNSNPPPPLDEDKLLVFADYLMWCYAWAIDCSESGNRGKVALISGERDHYVADSFDSFLERYVRDDTDLHN
jgi:hypothetical protein